MKRTGFYIYILTIAMLLIGLVMVMSASSTVSYEKSQAIFGLFNKHFIKVILGIVVLTGVAAIPYRSYIKLVKPALLLSIILLVITLFMPARNNASRWINLGFLSFQPVDFVRIVIMIYLAAYLEDKASEIVNIDKFMKPFIWVILLVGLILLQPNVSSGILMLVVTLTLLYIGGAKFTHVAGISALSLSIVGAVAFILPHSHKRIMTFINGMNDGGDSMHHQVKQSLLALGSGGFMGIGVGNSRQSNLFLPESYSDFIFAIIGEEFGFIGAISLTVLFLLLFYLGYRVAIKAPDKYGQLLGFGITFSIALYAFVNIAVVTGLVPATGLPLPFISYGGTSILFLAASVGILINIAYSAGKLESGKTIDKNNPARA